MFQILINKNYPFIPKRKIALVLSITLILIGVGSLVMKGGPNYGIDFKGGYKFIVKFESDLELSDLRQAILAAGFEGAQVSDFGSDREVLIVLEANEEVTSGDDVAGDAVQKGLTAALRTAFTDNRILDISQEKVGPKIGAELRSQGIWAIIYSLLGIVLYITWRFEFRFSIAAIMALVHDVLLTLGAFSLLDKEINLTILGALLTIVGYSLNDTIVVFDRIRENLNTRKRGEEYGSVVNRSVNETLSRTVITSFTTLVVVLILFFYGGPVIHDFAFALMIGVIVGTYSSIFIASPTLVEWQLMVTRRRAGKLAKA